MNILDQARRDLELRTADIDQYASYDPHEAGVLGIEELLERTKKHILMPESERGIQLESQKTAEVFKARPGEFTVESGKQGCGKSARHTLRAMAFANQGQSSCICSMEMKPEETITRMFHQFTGTVDPTIRLLEEMVDHFKGKVYLFSKVGSQGTKRILNLVKHCAANNIQHLMIDSLMKCGVRSSDLDKLETFANELQGLAKDLGVHIWLIAHQGKGHEGQTKEDGVRGSGMLLDLADNFILYEKNERKFEVAAKQEMQKAIGEELTAKEKEILAYPDFYMEFRKQRHSTVALPRKFGFWGHESMQFLPSEKALKLSNFDWMEGRTG